MFTIEKEPQALIEVTANAATRIKEMLQKEGKPNAGLRVRIVAGGCSGLQYKLEFTETPRKDDNIVEAGGGKVFVDPKSAVFLTGTQLDYVDALMGGGFRINNPHAKAKCSCGESFTA